jgi:hypothetical protein
MGPKTDNPSLLKKTSLLIYNLYVICFSPLNEERHYSILEW